VSKGLIIGLLAGVLAAGAVFLFWQNGARQRTMEKRLTELQQQVASATRSGSLVGGRPIVPEIIAPSSTAVAPRELTVLDQQRNMRTVMDEGWRLINQRDPKAAAQAAAIFREGLEKVDAKNAQFYNGLGRALLIAGEPRDAISAWENGLKLDAGISDMRSGIGWAYWNLHDPYHAKEAWEQALAADPKSLDAWSAMVWIYLALGDTEKSKTGFQVLYQTDRQNKDWILGLQMAQARNTDPTQIARFFPLPPLAAFAAPVTAASATAPGVAPKP
jgi:tetratricopeptide (TPR) repeat protein